MATDARTAAYVLEQLGGAGDIRARKMFGEYAVYLDDKVIGFICDDDLFVKETAAGESFLARSHLAPYYPGSKDAYRVPADLLEDRDRLVAFVVESAALLPAPKPTSAKKRKPKAGDHSERRTAVRPAPSDLEAEANGFDLRGETGSH